MMKPLSNAERQKRRIEKQKKKENLKSLNVKKQKKEKDHIRKRTRI